MSIDHLSKRSNQSKFFLLRFINEWLYNTGTHLIALSFALFSLVGRWGEGRLFGVDTDNISLEWKFIFQPRSWFMLILFFCSLLFFRTIRTDRFAQSGQDYLVRIEHRKKVLLILQLSLFIFLIISSTFTFYSEALLTKLYDCVLIILFILSAFIISAMKNRYELLYWIWFYMVSIAFLLFIFSLPNIFRGGVIESDGTERLSALGGGPNVFVRYVSLCLINSLYLFIHTRRLRHAVVIPLFIFAIFLSGSRGGMIAIMISIVVMFYLERKYIKKYTFKILMAICFSIVTIAFITPNLVKRTYNIIERRIIIKTIEQGSSSGRDEIFYRAYTHGLESPIWGHGLASWQNNGEGTNYPHNLFLELFYESGLFGVILCALAIFLSFITMRFIRKKSNANSKYICFTIMILIASMFSGDIFDTRCLFAMLFFLCVPDLKTQYPSNNSNKKIHI